MTSRKSILSEIKCCENTDSWNSISQDLLSLLTTHKCYYIISKTEKTILDFNYRVEKMLNIQRIKNNLHEIFPIIADFEKNNIPYSLLKGPFLSQQLYNDCFMRSSSDIDILVNPEDIQQIKLILNKFGFVQGRLFNNSVTKYSRESQLFYTLNTHQAAPFRKVISESLAGSCSIDLNTNLMWGESNQKIDTKKLLDSTVYLNFLNQTVNVLNNEMNFIALCLHSYKDLNSIFVLSKKGVNLNSIFDIYFYLKFIKIDFGELRRLIVQNRVGEYIYYCIYYVNMFFDNNISNKVLEVLSDFKNDKIINSFGLTEDKLQWDIEFEDRLSVEIVRNYFNSKLTDKEKSTIINNEYYL